MTNATQPVQLAPNNNTRATKPKKRTYAPQFKFERAMDAIKNPSQIAEYARQYGFSSKLMYLWKSQLQARGAKIFETTPDQTINELKTKVARLEQMLGKKEVELALLKNFSDFYQSKNTS